VWYQNILSALFGFVTKHACDRLTDRQTELRQLIPHYNYQDRTSIVALHSKNEQIQFHFNAQYHISLPTPLPIVRPATLRFLTNTVYCNINSNFWTYN